jgi:rhamnose utilization protein RhaD (predicted bifunctional aldolase and dehydrogenase)
MGLAQIAEISREFGSDEKYVLAGGGNTSYKDSESLWIKASGYALATIGEDGFVRMERRKLAEIWTRKYPENSEEREAVALADLMAARAPGEENKRPSVETLLHEAIPASYVVHTHPSLVNGLTCANEGKQASERLFGDSVLWIPIVNPGYILAKTVKDALARYAASIGTEPDFILLQNHGVFISSDTLDGIRALYGKLFTAIEGALTRRPDTSEVTVDQDAVSRYSKAVSDAWGGGESCSVRFLSNAEILMVVADEVSFEPVSSAYTPDQIVYCGHKALFVDRSGGSGAVGDEIDGFIDAEGVPPKVVAVSGLGIFGCGTSGKAAENAVLLFNDVAKIAAYTGSFGGHRFMPKDQIDFIRSWEVESYRSKISTQGQGGTER